MADQLVATEKTTMSTAQVFAALSGAWKALLGTEAPRAALLVLLAQWAHETGGGGRSNNWNLAGIQHTPGDGHDFARYETVEVIDGVRTAVPKNFRAYGSLEESAFDYLRTLRRDFLFAWPAVEAGDPVDFAHRLKLRHYYTDTEAIYTAGLRAWFARLDAQIPADVVGALPTGHPAVLLPDPIGPEVEPPDEVA